MTAAGFALTLYVFYPGIMTFDALYIYKDMAKGTFGDWQSPVMIALWSLIDPIAPGTGKHPAADGGALLAELSRSAALAIARRSPQLALLRADSRAFAARLRPRRRHLARHFVRNRLAAWPPPRFSPRRTRLEGARSGADLAFALLAFGVLLRPNALAAAPTSRSLHHLAHALFLEAHARSFMCPPRSGCLGWCKWFITASSMRAAASAALDHGVRSWRHFPFRQGKRFSRHLDHEGERRSSPMAVTSRSRGTFIGRNSRACS